MDKIDKVLSSLGIFSGVKGYQYIKDAMEIAKDYPDCFSHGNRCKTYRKIGERYNDDWHNVERNIRLVFLRFKKTVKNNSGFNFGKFPYLQNWIFMKPGDFLNALRLAMEDKEK